MSNYHGGELGLDATSPPPRRVGSSRLGVIAVLAAVVVIGASIVWLTRPPQPVLTTVPTPAPAAPAEAEHTPLNIFVRPPTRAAPQLSVEEPGALPVSGGSIMNLQAVLPELSFTYFVWIDSSGRVVPLYPWNNKDLEVTDIGATPPLRMSAKTVLSPLLGSSWTFGPQAGAETALLLVRAEALPESVKLGELFAESPPPVSAGSETELVIMEVRNHAKDVTTVLSRDRGDEAAAKAADEPLKALLLRLSPHFDLVRAVRFAHIEGGSEEASAKAKSAPE